MSENQKSAHAKLYEAIEALILDRAYVNGQVISALPQSYVMVRDLRQVLADNKVHLED